MQKETQLTSKIEAILFWKAEPVSVSKLAEIIGVSESEIGVAIKELKELCKDRGVTVIEHTGEVTMVTSDSVSSIIEGLQKEELSRDLGKAGLETLSIILYQGPVSRSEIDFIRGVNSQFILRNLLIRGLIEKVENPNDQRVNLYKPTLSLLAHLGVTGVEGLPDFESVRKDIEAFKKNTDEEDKAN